MPTSGPGLFHFDIKIKGTLLQESLVSAVARIELRQPLHDHHECVVEFDSLGEEGPPKALVDSLGADFELGMGSGTSDSREDQLVFKGKITQVQPVYDGESGLGFHLRAHSPTLQLDDVPRNRVAEEIKASVWAQDAIGERGLSASIDSTSHVFPELVQRGETDWEFARRLLAQEGITLFYDGEDIKGLKGLASAAAALTLSPSSSPALLSFECDVSLQPLHHEARAWAVQDPKPLVESTKALKGIGSGPYLDKAKKASQSHFATMGAVQPEFAPGEMSLLSSDVTSLGRASASGLVRGRGRSDCMQLRPGSVVTIEGLGQFGGDGEYVVTAVVHTVDGKAGYRNEFHVCDKGGYGPPRWPRAGRDGEIWLAKVVDVYDPEKQGRVRVSFLNYPDGQACWARLSTAYAGKGGGIYFLPEIDDEVVVGFTEGDHRYPVVLGSVFAPKYESPVIKGIADNHGDGSNPHDKVIHTKAGHRIWLREREGEAVTIELLTPKDECRIVLTEDADKSTIEIDTAGNIQLTAKGECQITAEKDVSVTTKGATNLSSDGDVKVESQGKVEVKASGDMKLEGMNIELKSSGGSIKLSPSGADIKGAMIKLN